MTLRDLSLHSGSIRHEEICISAEPTAVFGSIAGGMQCHRCCRQLTKFCCVLTTHGSPYAKLIMHCGVPSMRC